MVFPPSHIRISLVVTPMAPRRASPEARLPFIASTSSPQLGADAHHWAAGALGTCGVPARFCA